MKVSSTTWSAPRAIKPPCMDGAEGSKPAGNAVPNWWAPVWKGLFLDGDGRHYKRIKSAIWLLLYFFLCADRKTGSLKRKFSTISRETGVKTRTIRTWLNSLRKGGYITTESSGRCLTVVINKWKTLPNGHSYDRQGGGFMAGRVAKECHSEAGQKGREIQHLSSNPGVHRNANDITINKNINNDNNVVPQETPIGPKNDRDFLAHEICDAFKDGENRPLYLSYVRKYPLEIIKRAFDEAVKLPTDKVRKNRGALFNYLVKHHAQK